MELFPTLEVGRTNVLVLSLEDEVASAVKECAGKVAEVIVVRTVFVIESVAGAHVPLLI